MARTLNLPINHALNFWALPQFCGYAETGAAAMTAAAAAAAHEEIQKTEKEKQRTRLLITTHEKKRYKTNTNIKYNLLLL